MSETSKTLEENLDWSDGDFCLFKPINNPHVIHEDVLLLEDSLKVVCSSLPGGEEAKLFRLLLALKVRHWTLQPECGVVSSFHVGSSLPAQLYTCLINTNDSSNESKNNFLLCYLSTRDTGLELFREDLDTFIVKSIKPLLKTLPVDCTNISSDTEIYKVIHSWKTELTYISKLVQKYHNDLPVLLYIALNNTVRIDGDNPNDVKELYKFINCCSVNALMESQKVQPLLIDIENDNSSNPLATITLKGDDIIISTAETNEFCKKWSKLLQSRGTTEVDPFFIKKVIETYKLKIIQDMNAFKRLIRDAETNYYSLYKCYTFLISTGNVDLILKCSLNEANSQDEVETKAVVNALIEFIENRKNY